MRVFVAFLLLLLSIPALCHPTGEFLAGEFDGEDFKFRLIFQDNEVVVHSLEEGWTETCELRDAGSDRHTFTLSRDSESMEVTVFQAADDELVFRSSTKGSVLKGWKTTVKPSWLTGKWVDDEGRAFTFSPDGLTLKKGSETHKVEMFALTSQRSIARLILVPEDMVKESILLHFVLLDQNEMLVWDLDDGDVKSFTRDGWLAD
jgi:hypothetical protein